jgi:hypothetical protein
MRGAVAKRLRGRARYLSVGARSSKKFEKMLKREWMSLTGPERAPDREQVGVGIAHQMKRDFGVLRRRTVLDRLLRRKKS